MGIKHRAIRQKAAARDTSPKRERLLGMSSLFQIGKVNAGRVNAGLQRFACAFYTTSDESIPLKLGVQAIKSVQSSKSVDYFLLVLACSLLRTVDNIATPCSVKT